VEEGPLEWRNAPFWLPFGQIILGCKGSCPKINWNLAKCILQGVCAHPRCWKNWPECWKSCAITYKNGPKRTFLRKHTCKPFWPGDIPLVVLCIKLWSVRGGGTVRVSKCNISISIWASNSRLQRHLTSRKRLETCTLRSKVNENLAKYLLQGVCAHPGCWKKLSRMLKIVCYNPRKWPEMDIFAKTRLQSLLAWRRTPGGVMH
jgi:hypothetical protein